VFSGGNQGGTLDPIIDEVLYNKSVRQMLGGDGEEDTGIVNLSASFVGVFNEYEDLKTILPPGVTKEGFENWVATSTPETWKKLGGLPRYVDGTEATVEDLAQEGIFVRVGAEDYGIIMASDGEPLQNDVGERYIVRITQDDVKGYPGFLDRIQSRGYFEPGKVKFAEVLLNKDGRSGSVPDETVQQLFDAMADPDSALYQGDVNVSNREFVTHEQFTAEVAPRLASGAQLDMAIRNSDIPIPYLRPDPSSKGSVKHPAEREFLQQYKSAVDKINKSPIASLGYDPEHTIFNFAERRLNIAGYYSPDSDQLIVLPKTKASTGDITTSEFITHESIHRGFEKLRDSGAMPNELLDVIRRFREETVVRAYMKEKYGTAVGLERYKKLVAKLLKVITAKELVAIIDTAAVQAGAK